MTDPVPFRPISPGTQPPYDAPAYLGTIKRHPKQKLHPMPHTITETTGPSFSAVAFPAAGRPDDGDRQAGAGRAHHRRRHHHRRGRAAGAAHDDRDLAGQRHRPLRPSGRISTTRRSIRISTARARVFTDEHGRYRFLTIRPGAYPWPNHRNAWRPNHIHFSYFGPAFATRLVTQMYFPGDPLLAFDPIFHAVPDEHARNRLIAAFDLDITEPDYALGYRFDVVLRGRDATPMGH